MLPKKDSNSQKKSSEMKGWRCHVYVKHRHTQHNGIAICIFWYFHTWNWWLCGITFLFANRGWNPFTFICMVQATSQVHIKIIIIATTDLFPKIQNDNNHNEHEKCVLISLGRIVQIILNSSFAFSIECDVLSIACYYYPNKNIYYGLPSGCVSTKYAVWFEWKVDFFIVFKS